MRRILDGIYGGALIVACAAMVAIAVLVLAQVLGRVIDRAAGLLGLEPLGLAIPSLAEMGGFLFVGAACLALPATLRAGGHIRVSLLLGLMPPGLARALGALVLLAALGLSGFAAWNSGTQALDSWQFGALSFGVVAMPLWIPQAVMTGGLVLLAVALADELLSLVRGAEPSFQRAERARTIEGH